MEVVISENGETEAGEESPATEVMEDAAESAVAVAAAAVALSEQVAASAELQAAEVMREAEHKINEDESKWLNLQSKVETLETVSQNLASDLQMTREAMGQMAAELLAKLDTLTPQNTQATSQNEDADDLLNSELVTVELDGQPLPQLENKARNRVWI